MDITLERYHGLGNDYLVYDPNKNELELNEENVKMLCNRNMGLGADGILEGPLMEEKQMAVRIWNPNGSIAEKSGNGVRIFAKYLKDAGYVQKKHYTMLTDGGEEEITYLNEEGSRLKVSMGKLSFWSDEIPVIGERRQVINEDMVFGRTLYLCIHRKSALRDPDAGDFRATGVQDRKGVRARKVFPESYQYRTHECH